MDKIITTEEFQKELSNIIIEMNRIRESAEIQVQTTDFLVSESQRLADKVENPDITFDEKEILQKQIQAMLLRMQREIEIIQKDMPRLNELEKRVEYLSELKRDGKII